MKKFLLSSALGLVLTLCGYSQLILTENFNGLNQGNLSNQNGWVPFYYGANTTDVQVTNASPLSYPGYGSGGNYVKFLTGDDPYKSFTSPIPTTADTSIYTMFLVNVSSAAAGSCSQFSVALRSENGKYISRFNVLSNNGHLRFGISKGNYGNSQQASSVTGNFSFNTTYLILLKYDFNYLAQDSMYLWVNPALTLTPPSTAIADAKASDNELAYGNNIVALQLSQGAGQCNAPHVTFDDFNVSTTWLGFFEAGGPLPTTASSLRASQKKDGIQLDWINYTESGINHYEIQRSIDGRNFSNIANENAKSNHNNRVDYSYTDKSATQPTNYYRIKFVYNDGKTEFSTIARVFTGKQGGEMTIYPNPVHNSVLSMQIADLEKGTYAMRIYNSAGMLMLSSQMQHEGGSSNQSVQLPSSFKPGMYSLQLSGSNKTIMHKAFLVL